MTASLTRLSSVLVLGLLLLGVLATPALAHGRGSDATNMRSTITSAPDVDGVTWRVYGGDEYLWVENTSDAELLVYGYDQRVAEPFLRIGPDGVFENRLSPSAAISRERYTTQAPAGTDAGAEPDWVKISDEPRYGWHDHRIHWMAPGVPPAVSDTSATTQVLEWAVPFAVAGAEHELTGELVWIPGPSAWPWVGLALVLVLPALAGLRTRPEEDAEGHPVRWAGLARPAAVVLGAVALVNLTHLVDDFFAVPLPFATAALAGAQTLLFSAIGLFGAWRGWQAREGAFTALGVGSGAIFVGQGLLYLAALTASQLATVFPVPFARLVIALSLVQVVPLAIVAVVGTRRLLPPLEEADAMPVGGSPEPASS